MRNVQAIPWSARTLSSRGVVPMVISAGVLAVLAFQTAQTFLRPDSSAQSFGTTSAPYSDALGPWLVGGLSILLGVPVPAQLVRPTVGVFWSSLLGATGRIESIPLFFVAAGFALLACALFVSKDRRLRDAYMILTALFALAFDQLWGPLSLATTNVDFAAFVFTFTGAMLLLSDDWRTVPDTGTLFAAALMLGVAGAIRGPMLAGGIVLIGARWLTAEPRRSAGWWMAWGAFVLPLGIDIVLQHRLGIHSNATGFMFCTYWGSSHSPTPACAQAYLTTTKTAGEITHDYLSFLFSKAGVLFLADGFSWRLSREIAIGTRPWVIAAMAVGLLSTCVGDRHPITRMAGADALGSDRRLPWASWKRGAVMGGSLVVFGFLAGQHASASILWLGIPLAMAIHQRLVRGGVCIIAYVCGTLFLCLLGVESDRYESTFAFLLYLGLALLVTDGLLSSSSMRVRSPLAPTAWSAIALTLCLYIGQSLLPSALRATFRAEVDGRQAAVKISDDARIDRSLYYTGQRELMYTRHDDRRLGTVRSFHGIAFPGVIENASFIQPNAFLE